MNKRIRKKHFDLFAKAVMYFAWNGDPRETYSEARQVDGKTAEKCWKYMRETGHEPLFREKPVFKPERNYVFCVTWRPDGRKLVEPIMVTPIDEDKPAHFGEPRPTRAER